MDISGRNYLLWHAVLVIIPSPSPHPPLKYLEIAFFQFSYLLKLTYPKTDPIQTLSITLILILNPYTVLTLNP